MKKFLLFTGMLFCMLFVSQGIQAGDSYWYAQLTVTTNPESGAGMVYADRFKIDEDGATRTYEADSFTGEGRATSKGGEGTFHAYAKPNRGYVFDHWNNAGDESVTEDEITVTRVVYGEEDGKDNNTKYTEYSDLVAYFTANDPIAGGMTFNTVDGGTYTVDYELLEAAEDPVVPANNFVTYNTDVITLTATPTSGYNFKGWKKNGTIVSYANPWQTSFDAAATIEPVFEAGQPNFKVDGVTFVTLNEAITFAQSEACATHIIVVNQNYTLPAGDYTIPNGVTLLVPYEATNALNTVPFAQTGGPAAPSVYRNLTLASNANLTVYGAICVNAKLCFAMGYNALPLSKYGQISMQEGSNITLKNGSNLYSWGYITGNGTIDAENGAAVSETFQFNYRGYWASSAFVGDEHKVFPFNQYYIQNIEVPVTFQYGSQEIVYTGMHKDDEPTRVEFLGTASGLFRMQEGTTIKKWYDGTNDRQKYELSGNAELNSIHLAIMGMNVNSADYTLPITNNMDIHIKSGTTTISSDIEILPDASVTIDNGATLHIGESVNVYIHDSQQWNRQYAYVEGYKVAAIKSDANALVAPVVYAPSKATTRTSVTDATFDVNGTISVEGYLYTTADGADIKSSGNGNIILTMHEEYASNTYQPIQYNSDQIRYDTLSITPAQLHNADGTYTPTANNNLTNTFEYQDGKWLAIVPENTAVEDGKELVVNYEEQLEAIDTLQVSNGGTVTVSTDIEKPVVVENGGTVNVAEDTELSSLALNACPADINNEEGTAGQSSQVTGSGEIAANSNIYLDIKMHPSGNMNYLLWYTFAVPFNVAIDGGIEKVDNKGNATPAVSNVDYRCYTYDGQARADGDLTNAWVQVTSSTDDGYFVPGKFYLIEFNSNAYNTFRFHKAEDAVVNNAQNLTLEAYESANEKDGGWNAIANTALKGAKITISDGTLVAQIYNPVNRKFETVVLSQTTLALGAALFVQVSQGASANNSVVSTPSSIVAKRAQAAETEKTYGLYQLRIGQVESTFDDQLIFSATTQEKQGYKAGKDLTKMFMGNAAVAQMWINDYNAKLTMNEMPMTNGKANASMTIYAPKAYEYELRLKSIPEDVDIYLTFNGELIWNLCNGNYIASLNQGNNEGYGLRIVAKGPKITTGIEEAIVDTPENDTRKVLIDGQVFIIHGNKAYTVEGQNVK